MNPDLEYEREAYLAECVSKGIVELNGGRDFTFTDCDTKEDVTVYYNSIIDSALGEMDSDELSEMMFGLTHGTSAARNKLKSAILAEIEKTLQVYLK